MPPAVSPGRITCMVEPETLEHPVNQGSHNAVRLDHAQP